MQFIDFSHKFSSGFDSCILSEIMKLQSNLTAQNSELKIRHVTYCFWTYCCCFYYHCSCTCYFSCYLTFFIHACHHGVCMISWVCGGLHHSLNHCCAPLNWQPLIFWNLSQTTLSCPAQCFWDQSSPIFKTFLIRSMMLWMLTRSLSPWRAYSWFKIPSQCLLQ